MLLGFREQAMGSRDRRSPTRRTAAAPHWQLAIQFINLLSERRRIVAQVRRKPLKNRDFFAARDSVQWRDDLFTTGVDNADRAGL